MTKQLDRAGTPAATEYATGYLVFELSKASWKLGVMLPGSPKISRYTIEGGDLKGLAARLADIRARAGRDGKPVRILSCFEAGLDGHWLHRWLTDQGVVKINNPQQSWGFKRGTAKGGYKGFWD